NLYGTIPVTSRLEKKVRATESARHPSHRLPNIPLSLKAAVSKARTPHNRGDAGLLYLTKSESRRGLLVWQTLGFLDLIIAVTLGVLASPRIHLIGNGMTTAALTVLPLSVIPTFGVPLAIIFHIVCIANLSRSERTRRTSLEHPVAPHSVSIAR